MSWPSCFSLDELVRAVVPDLDRAGAVLALSGSRPRTWRTRAGDPRRAPRASGRPARAARPSAPPTTRARRSARAGSRSGGGARRGAGRRRSAPRTGSRRSEKGSGVRAGSRLRRYSRRLTRYTFSHRLIHGVDTGFHACLFPRLKTLWTLWKGRMPGKDAHAAELRPPAPAQLLARCVLQLGQRLGQAPPRGAQRHRRGRAGPRLPAPARRRRSRRGRGSGARPA